MLALLTGIQAWAEPLIGRLLSEGSQAQRHLDLSIGELREESPLDSEERAEQAQKAGREAIAQPSITAEKPTAYEQLPLDHIGRDLDLSVGELREESPLDSQARAEQAHRVGREAIAQPSSAEEKPTPYKQLPLDLDSNEWQNHA